MSDAAQDIERLDRAIERLTSHQPVLMFDDAELDELLELAKHLHHDLPDDVPDPLFRESLREQLLDPRPRLVAAQPATSERRRSPLFAVSGAIAAVMVVAVAVSIVASSQFGGDGGGGDQDENAEFLGSNVSIPAVTTATATIGGMVAVATREPQADDPTAIARNSAIPPLDSEHIEYGAMTTVETGLPSNTDAVTYTLSSNMPESQSSAPVYRFAVPEMDAMSLLNRVTDALSLDGEMTTRSVRGKTVITFQSTRGTTFTWMPASGAFACNLSGEARVQGTNDEMIAEAHSWLLSSGFPLRDPLPEPVAIEMESGMLKIDFPVEVTPDVALGHPLTVSIMIDKEGVIQTVSGYWLQLIETQQIGMLSPEEAWQEMSDGKGFWSSGVPIEDSGNFEVDSFAVAYVLTVDDHNQLVLQPVYRATGQFKDYRGHIVDGVTVMVQAVTDDFR